MANGRGKAYFDARFNADVHMNNLFPARFTWPAVRAFIYPRRGTRVFFFLFISSFFSFFIEEKKRSAPGACRREYDTRPPCVSRYNSLAALRRSIINFHDRLTSTVRMTNDEYCISPSSFDGLALRNQREKKKKKKEKNSNLCTGGKVVLGRRSTTLEPCNFESWNKVAIEGLWNRQLCSLEVGQFEVFFNAKSNYERP